MASVTKPVLLNETGEQIVEAINKVAEAIGGNSGGNSSGGGLPTGGEPHQMLVTDGDGNAKWEARTHYSENTEVYLYSDVTAVFTDNGHVISEVYSAYPEVGNTYTVSIGDTHFDCVASPFDMGGVVSVSLGNQSPMGGADTGEPFLMVIPPEDVASSTGMYAMVMMLTGETNDITVSVRGMAEVIHKIDEKYIPSVGASSLVNGSAPGSVRQILGIAEDESYTMGHCAVAFGGLSKASGEDSFAACGGVTNGERTAAVNEGGADGISSFAANYGTTYTDSTGAFAANYGRADGLGSFAAGNSSAYGKYAFAAGEGCKANGGQFVIGEYNVEDNISLHIVGYGTSDTSRKNVHTLSRQGDAWFAGTVEGTALILKSSTSGSTKRFKITVDDSGTITATEVT